MLNVSLGGKCLEVNFQELETSFGEKDFFFWVWEGSLVSKVLDI